MKNETIRVRSWADAGADDHREGLCGWVVIAIGAFAIGSIALRRTSTGRHTLAFPSRTAKGGQRHAIVAPLGDAARRRVEREIFEQLRDDYGLDIKEEDR